MPGAYNRDPKCHATPDSAKGAPMVNILICSNDSRFRKENVPRFDFVLTMSGRNSSQPD
jgi:hypothetical protein